MKLSLRWLQRYVDLSDKTPRQVAEDLTLSTAEVEGVEVFGGGIDDVVIGHVIECGRHPNADKLSVTKVDIGGDEPLGIVCGAPNIAQGQHVAVAPVGAVLPGDFKIKATKIRGEASAGMICSERELGLSEDHEGIMVLDPAAYPELAPGRKLVDLLPLPDHVLEIDNKSINHRPDLWGHYGVARELAAIYERPLRAPEVVETLPTGEGRALAIQIEDTADCPRFTGLVIDGVKATRSPTWLRYLLQATGQRSIDLLVDLTNFVMLDLGQPMHAFDLSFLDASGITVRRARDGEELTTLDGEEQKLSTDDIVVAFGDRAVSLAGIKGGQGSAVQASTGTLFVEVANWRPGAIRSTSTRLALRTDASARFEKALDPALCELAQRRFLHLVQSECPSAKAAGPLVDPSGWAYEPVQIKLRSQRLEAKLGVAIPADRVRSILTALEFGVEDVADGFAVTVPSFRATKDVRIEDDLIEEVGRMFRFENIPPTPLQSAMVLPPKDSELFVAQSALRAAALELHCHEVMSYSFVEDRILDAVGAADQDYSRVGEPVAPELSRMRRHVMPSLLAHVPAALRELAEVRLVEHGKGYQPEHRDQHGLPAESRELALVIARRSGTHPLGELRTAIDGLLRRLSRPVEIEALPDVGDCTWVHPGKAVVLRRGATDVGYVAALHPNVCRALELPTTVAIASIDLRSLVKAGRDELAYRPISKFPSQTVDVALIVPETRQVGEVVTVLRTAGKKLVRDVSLFEVYRGEQVGADRKSLNFTVTLGSDERTLTDADGQKFLDRLRRQCGTIDAELRG